MRFKIRFASQIVGIFVVFSLLILSAFIILMGVNQRWFARNYHFITRFASGRGINIGMPISFRGFEIGKVVASRLTDDNTVEVRFYIQDTYYPKIYEHSVIQLTSNPLGIGGGMVFHQGRLPTDPPPEETYIPSLDFEEGRELVRRGLVNLPREDDTVSNLIASLGPVLANVNTTLITMNDLLDTMNAAAEGRDPGPVGSIVRDVQAIASDVQKTTSAVGSSIDMTMQRTNELLANLAAITDNLRATSEALRDPRGAVTTLLDPKGSLATLLDDNDELYLRIDSILRAVNESVLEVRDFTRFINTTRPQILGALEEGRAAISQGRDVLEGVRNNPLIRGGIPERAIQPSTIGGFRDEGF